MTILIIIGYIFLWIAGALPLFRSKEKKEAILYTGVLSISLIMSVILVSGIKYKDLASIIEDSLMPIFNRWYTR